MPGQMHSSKMRVTYQIFENLYENLERCFSNLLDIKNISRNEIP